MRCPFSCRDVRGNRRRGITKNVKTEHCQWKLCKLNNITVTVAIKCLDGLFPPNWGLPSSPLSHCHPSTDSLMAFVLLQLTGAPQPPALICRKEAGVAIAEQEASWTELQPAPEISPGPSHIGRTCCITCGAPCWKLVKNFKAVTTKH